MSDRRQERLDDMARCATGPARSGASLVLLVLGVLAGVVLVLYGLTYVFME